MKSERKRKRGQHEEEASTHVHGTTCMPVQEESQERANDVDGDKAIPRSRLASSARIPAALRAILDFNQKGLNEVVPPTTHRQRRPTAKASAVMGPAGPQLPPSLPTPPSQHKMWILLAAATHRRFRLAMGRAYQYKQHVPTPTWLRQHKYPFCVRVQNPGEMVVTVGASHYVISGETHGFSWSHADPSTLSRLHDSTQHHDSTQADGKPNSFSELFSRSRHLLDHIEQNLQTPYWQQGSDAVAAQVRATRTDKTYQLLRLDEGWRPEELRPVLLPTERQFQDPYWFTAMMLGPGREHGSLHIRLPELYRFDASRGFGTIHWPVSTPYHRFAVFRTTRPAASTCITSSDDANTAQDFKQGLGQEIVSVKVLRPESRGFIGVRGYTPHVPTAPHALSSLIEALPSIREPIYYCPQHPVNPEQQAQLASLLPAWAMPTSEIDGLRNLFKDPALGTTTATAFGGSFGITGLHDEYNHTVSMFVYPFRKAHEPTADAETSCSRARSAVPHAFSPGAVHPMATMPAADMPAVEPSVPMAWGDTITIESPVKAYADVVFIS